MMSRRWRLMSALVLAVVAAGCSTAPRPGLTRTTVPYALAAPTTTPAPLAFPRDDGSHDALTEWWYYTGHVDAGGSEYGFEVVFFRSSRRSGAVGYAAHAAVTDRSRQTFTYDQRSTLAPFATSEPEINLVVTDWSIRGSGGNDRITVSIPGYALDFTLASERPPTLHGGTGVISFGPAGDSYYYSRTRMAIQGTLTVDGISLAARGTAWMDHQWGDFISAGGGWDWFSFHLDDGSDLTGSIVRGADGEPQLVYGTLVDPAGLVHHLPAADFIARPQGEWTSPRSGATYPVEWSIAVPSRAIALTVRPVVRDQELDTRSTTGVMYWEGSVEARGSIGDRPLTGRGYVELTGYASRLDGNPKGARS